MRSVHFTLWEERGIISDLNSFLESALDELDTAISDKDFSRLIISSPRAASNIYKKIVAVPIIIKNTALVQFSFYAADKVVHHNAAGVEIRHKLEEIYELSYKQWEIDCGVHSFKLLIGKKGNYKKIAAPKEAAPIDYSHNRTKNHILKDGEANDLLIKLGLMSKDGKIYADKQRKFRQINKFLEVLSNIAPHVKDDAHILDFGCGKSYLSFALYHYFNFVLDKNVTVTGLDLKADVIEHCNERAAHLGYDNLAFHCGDIRDFESFDELDMVVTLHACDTATDYALAHALNKGAKIILSVPCCQHELFPQIDNELLEPILKHGALKERFASLLTDALRGQLLEALGYDVSIVEFTSYEDTAKNLMIRAVKARDGVNSDKLEKYQELAKEFGVEPMLYGLVRDGFNL